MKRLSLIILLSGFLLMTCTGKKDSDPENNLTEQERKNIIDILIRQAVKPPENVNGDNRFKPEHDKYYNEKAKNIRLERYVVKDEGHFFLLSQPAPSLYEKRHATGGRFTLNNKKELVDYEEIFRTWKMTPDTLKRRSFLLFEKMVQGESLEPYYTKNNDVEYIEFPDDLVFFDTKSKSWRTRN